MNELEPILNKFESISLEEMDVVKLMDRTDTKYLFSRRKLPAILSELAKNYRILEINNKRTNSYRTLYYDTPDSTFFRLHQNGKRNRYKVRMRKYLDSGLCFLEIKFKNNKGKTSKKRERKEDFENILSDESKQYIEKRTPFDADVLEPKIWSEFTRLTLVHRYQKERLTIDFGLKVNNDSRESELKDLIIAEMKHERASSRSDFTLVMKEHHIRPLRISKYCIGSVLIYPELKYNNFKPKLLAINKIQNEAA